MKIGDQVKIIIDKVDPDNRYHGMKGKIVDISFDDADSVTGDPEDNFMYKVQLENGETPDIHFRRNDLIPLEEYKKKMGEKMIGAEKLRFVGKTAAIAGASFSAVIAIGLRNTDPLISYSFIPLALVNLGIWYWIDQLE